MLYTLLQFITYCLDFPFPTLQLEETGTQLGHLSLQSEGGGGEAQQVEDGRNGEVGDNECATGGVSMKDAAENKDEVEKFLGSEDTSPEPTAPPESADLEGDSEATAVSTLPPLPPYSVLPPSQHTNVGPPMPPGQYAAGGATQYEMQAPPPYSALPPQYTSQTPSAPPLSGVAAQVNGQTSGQLHDFQCAVCKRKSKYRQPPGRRIAHVKCSTCKECTVCSATLYKTFSSLAPCFSLCMHELHAQGSK